MHLMLPFLEIREGFFAPGWKGLLSLEMRIFFWISLGLWIWAFLLIAVCLFACLLACLLVSFQDKKERKKESFTDSFESLLLSIVY